MKFQFSANDKEWHQTILNTFENITLHGYSKTVSWDQFHLLASFSSGENMPLSIIEALSNNMPVMAFKVGGVKEIINKTNGVVITKNTSPENLQNILNNRVFTFSDSKILSRFKLSVAFAEYEKLFR